LSGCRGGWSGMLAWAVPGAARAKGPACSTDLVRLICEGLPEIEYRGSAAGVAEFVVCLRGRPPMWELHAVCASWREGSEAALVSHGVQCEGFGRVAVQGAPYQRAGDAIVDLAVRASDEVGARQRATEALEAAHVNLRRFVSVTRRG
jgi:hypothetical protein